MKKAIILMILGIVLVSGCSNEGNWEQTACVIDCSWRNGFDPYEPISPKDYGCNITSLGDKYNYEGNCSNFIAHDKCCESCE